MLGNAPSGPMNPRPSFSRVAAAVAALLIASITFPIGLRAQTVERPSPEQLAALASTLKPRQGTIVLGNNLATLNVPESFGYLDPEQSKTLLERIWGNPPGTKTLGMLVPKGFAPNAKLSWAVTIQFEDEGYVKDDDAGKINYADLLKQMQERTQEVSKERVKKGYESVALVGWAAPPRYDPAAKKIYWAKELKFGSDPTNTLNYNIRILGRRGYLVLNGIGEMSSLPAIENATPQILSMVEFNQGHRYGDFVASTDKVATYGLAGLVAGGIAAKLGLFKGLWVLLLGAKKLVVVAVIGLVALFGKLLNRFLGVKSRDTASTASPPGPPPA
jgi:uncharacterized membrane-anchored protein